MTPTQSLSQLEAILQALIAEHEKLLKHLEGQQLAMRKLELKAMEQAAREQEAVRLRIAALETRRRGLVSQLGLQLRVGANPTLSRLVEAAPQAAAKLTPLRERLRGLMEQIAARATVAGRLASAVLGHLNTVVRLLAGAVEQAGLYTPQGIPQVSRRIGVMEAVG